MGGAYACVSVCVCVCVVGGYRFGRFLCLMAYQLFLGYLMPKPFS